MKKLSFIAILFFLFSLSNSCGGNNPLPPDPTPGGDTDEFYGEPFENVPDLDDIIMYEANQRLFAQNNSFNAIKARLDQIKSLGVNVLWLMPVTEQGKEKAFGSPYCVKDYRKTHAEYGTLDELRTLVEEAHKRDMAVIIDWVANHTSWDNQWLNDNKDWYTQDANGNVGPPAGTNWNDVVDLNYNNRKMRDEMIDAMKFWIREANIDGFRCDAADWVPTDFWRDAIYELRNLQKTRKLILLAEGTNPQNLQAGFDLDYGWNYCDVLEKLYAGNNSVADLFNSHTNEFGQIPVGKQKLRFTTNHDRASENSPVSKYKTTRGAMSAFVISTTMGGVPLIYSSQEIGYASKINFFNYVNINWESNQDIYQEYQKIMNIYKSKEAFKKGDLKSFVNKDIVCFTRSYENQTIMLIANVKNSTISYTLPDELTGGEWKNLYDNSIFQSSASLELEAYSYYILEKQ